MKNSHVSVLELDLKALEHNIEYFKSKLATDTKILCVVKAFSYGHDAVVISKALEKINIDYLAVAYVYEGVLLREAGIKTPILVLHAQVQNYQSLIEYSLEPNIYSKKTLVAFSEAAAENNCREYPIHLKFNTGLKRLGLDVKDIDFAIKTLKNSKHLKIQGLLSHLAASEDLSEKTFTKSQIQAFENITKRFTTTFEYPIIKHLANTSGIINYPETHLDMVRLGIGMYGFGNTTSETVQLKNVGSLKSIISQIHEINPGESLGYNRAYIATKKTMSATVPVGHADGVSRALGKGNGFVNIKGHKCPILGNVCMDMIMVDVTNVNCEEGDAVILFDSQETIEQWAQKSDTISYEILTGISQRIARKVKS
ncbi:MAG: alanine racemase [Flavicella sp.]